MSENNGLNKKQFVKALPHDEIELHGDDAIYQCKSDAITSMRIHRIRGMNFGIVNENYKNICIFPSHYVLTVIVGYYGRNRCEKCITFSAPTESEVEVFRDQINQIRYSAMPAGITDRVILYLLIKLRTLQK